LRFNVVLFYIDNIQPHSHIEIKKDKDIGFIYVYNLKEKYRMLAVGSLLFTLYSLLFTLYSLLFVLCSLFFALSTSQRITTELH